VAATNSVTKIFAGFSFLLSCLTGLVILVSACSYDGLAIEGKDCAANHPCPPGFLCVETPLSLTEKSGSCYREDLAPSCPAASFCGLDNKWVEVCIDGHSSEIETICQGEEVCNPDTALCAKSCESDPDCNADLHVCDLATGLCRPYPSCTGNSCPAGSMCVKDTVCVPVSGDTATIVTGTPGLDCFLLPPPSPPDDPPTCDLTGRVYLFPSSGSEQTVGLKIVLRPAGDTQTETTTTLIEQDPNYTCGGQPCGLYRLNSVATNQTYDIEIQAGTGDLGKTVVSTVRAGIVVRADKCNGGSQSLSLAVMSEDNFETYTEVVFSPFDPQRGLAIGWVGDCGNAQGSDRQALANVMVDFAIGPVAPGRIYYFAEDELILRPDTNLSDTTHKGYFAAAGIPATRNMIGFTAYRGGPRALGAVSFTAKPGAVVIAKLPLPADQLP